MNQNKAAAAGLVGWVLGALAGTAGATPFDVSTSDALNGITDIYSATFDPPLSPCGPGSPGYCAFFGGDPPASRALVISPTPTTVTTGIPGAIGPPTPPAGSFLDLTLNAGNTSVTLAGGSIRTPVLGIIISGTTTVTAEGAGFIIDAAPQTVPVDADGRAEFLVNLAPAKAADFSTLADVVTGCSGPLCALIPILTLDMIRYRLALDFDPSFGSFTGVFIGQTANNSLVFATLNSGVPDVAVTDSQPPGNDLAIPFGDVTELTSATRTVTVANPGGGRLFLGQLAQADPLAAPFALAGSGNCSGQVLLRNQTCAFDVVFTPENVGAFSDGFDIPSNDSDEASVTVAVSGSGVPTPVPDIAVADSVAPADDGEVPFGVLVAGGVANQTVTVSNIGTADLVLGQVAQADPLAAPFSVQADNCSGQTLVPAANCTFGLRFEPVAAGNFTDLFDIPSNDADSPSVLVEVTGTGTALAAPNIRITDPTPPGEDRQFTFEDVREGGSFDRTLTIVNSGNADLVIGTIGQANSLAAPFSFVAGQDHCSGQLLAPTALCTVRLRFEPAALGAATDAFDVPSNDPDEASVTVNVSGTGVESPAASPTPEPSGSSSGFMGLDAASLVLLLSAGLAGRRRRRPGRTG